MTNPLRTLRRTVPTGFNAPLLHSIMASAALVAQAMPCACHPDYLDVGVHGPNCAKAVRP